MTLDLSQIQFDYDFFTAPMPDGSTLVLNNVSDSLLTEGGDSAEIKRVNVLVIDAFTGDNLLCSSVIGMGNDRLIVGSADASLLGKVLTEDNMRECYIEMYEA